MNHCKAQADRRVLCTKMFLRNSLLTLMKEKPIEKITVTELCRHAQINRNTFYAHYYSPKDLLRSMEDELYEQVLRSFDVSLKAENLPVYLTNLCQVIYDNSDFCSVILSDNGNKVFIGRLTDLAHEKSIAEWGAAGMKADSEQTHFLFSFAANGGMFVIRTWVNSGLNKSPKEIALLLDKVLHSGLHSFFE